jgi:hypothetical protein
MADREIGPATRSRTTQVTASRHFGGEPPRTAEARIPGFPGHSFNRGVSWSFVPPSPHAIQFLETGAVCCVPNLYGADWDSKAETGL